MRNCTQTATRCSRRSGSNAGGVITEIGVADGKFSEFLLTTLEPAKFIAIDLFDLDKHPILWGVPQSVLFEGMSHYDFYRARFAPRSDQVGIYRGPSHEQLKLFPDEFFDLIYVDAAHDYESVKRDAELAQQKTKKTGIVVFNDYTLYDPLLGVEYGVVQAVNEILANGGWSVIGFALDRAMFCDIAIRRAAGQRSV
jgi:hypothetical protein